MPSLRSLSGLADECPAAQKIALCYAVTHLDVVDMGATDLLALLAAGIIASVAGRPYGEVVHAVGSPLAAAVFVLLFVATAVHMRIGMQIIIEDYISAPGLKVVLLVANTLFSYGLATVAVVAVMKLAVGG